MMARALHPSQRRAAIYNAVCDLHARNLEGYRIDSAAAWQYMQRMFPDITKAEFLQAAKTFSRVSSIICAHAEEGDLIFTHEIEDEIDAVVAAYARGEQILEH